VIRLWVDNPAIPAKAPHLAAAEKFINTSSTRRSARGSPIYPSDAMMQKLEFVNDLGDADKLYDEVWTQVNSK
jgi:spermidine/putrescine-binding protein